MITFRMHYGDDEVAVEFSEEELTILEEFLRLARRLEECRLVQMGMPFRFSIKLTEGEGTEVDITLPEWSDVEVYLYRLRPFILQGERTHFDGVSNILSRRLNHPTLTDFIKAIREEKKLYRGANIHQTVKITSNVDGTDVLLTSEEVLYDYLNGLGGYHYYERERNNFERLYMLFPTEFGQALCFWLLQEKGGAILRIAEFVRTIIDTYRGTMTQPIRAHLLAFNIGDRGPQRQG